MSAPSWIAAFNVATDNKDLLAALADWLLVTLCGLLLWHARRVLADFDALRKEFQEFRREDFAALSGRVGILWDRSERSERERGASDGPPHVGGYAPPLRSGR